MNFPFYIARRYLFSKKSHNVINVISVISIAGVTIGALAMVVILSIFNGIEGLVISLYSSFEPELRITPVAGKTFEPNSMMMERIRNLEGVVHYTDVLEENALLRYKDKQYIARIKGVEQDFVEMSGLDSMMVAGELNLGNLPAGKADEGQYFAIPGAGIAYALDVNLNDFVNPLNIYVPKRGTKVTLNPEQAFHRKKIYLSGVFSVQQEFDTKYVIVPIQFARNLLDYKNEVTAIELGLADNADRSLVEEQVREIAGPEFEVKNRFQQNELLYKTIKSEKWIIYMILSFILLIAIFNSVGSITMLIIEKKKDMGILQSIGATKQMVRRVFFLEGLLINVLGAIAGMILGAILCWTQIQFGWLKIAGAETFVVDAYPVQMQGTDFLFVLITIIVIGTFASWYPVRVITRMHLTDLKSA